MEKILIFGHKKPDTDSVTSAIALSYLKNKLGHKTEPRVLGNINNESKYVLDYFKISEPQYLNDVKLEIKDTNYRRGYFISEDRSILEAFKYMTEKAISTIPIIDSNGIFQGALAMKDIARNQVYGNYELLYTKFEYILELIEGKTILKINEEIKGNISAAYFKSATIIERNIIDEDSILIVGDRSVVIDYAISCRVKLLILTGGAFLNENQLEQAYLNKVNVISTEKSSFEVSTHIGLCNYIKTVKYTQDFMCFDETDHVSTLIEASNKTRFSYYPICDKNKKCLGLVKLADINDKKPKKVILVDHNEFQQSVDGIEEANILEVIDHHKIGNIGTSVPINFRNMPVGSTNTILYLIYEENNIEIPQDIAGIMMSGILSDTLILKSPTTTDFDKEAVKKLSEIAQVDYKEFGINMFKEGTRIVNKNKEELIFTDFKNFNTDNYKIGISQIFTLDINSFLIEKEEYSRIINNICIKNGYFLVLLFITDVINNGSYMFYSEGADDILKHSFNIIELNQGIYIKEVVSRKKQIIPTLLQYIK